MQYWTKEEIEVLKDNQHKTIKELSLILPGRNENAVRSKIMKLKLKYNKVGNLEQKKSGFLTCNKCGEIKEYNKINFRKLKINCNTCTICLSKINLINDYKRKYNIELDFYKLYETFSPIEWYLFYENKIIPKLPPEIFSKEDIKDIFKFIITNKMNCKTRDEINKICANDFRKYRIRHLIFNKFNYNSFYDFLCDLFPEYNLNPYELKEKPKGFLYSKENADNYMKYYINNIIKLNNIVNIQKEIAKYFNYNYIRRIKENSLICCITSYHHYTSFYEWLNYLFPDWQLKSGDFNNFICCDGINICNSLEEMYIYDFIYQYFKIRTLKCIGKSRNSKYKFYNSIFKENYYPDYILEYINNIKMDKPLIIEYFGWYYTNSSDKLIRKYIKKTSRKVAFFKSNKDIYFIDLYPEDLKNNFQGVKNKLTSFFIDNFSLDISQ